VITFMLEGLLSKERILTLYLNNVEWGEGVFGMPRPPARHYFRVDASPAQPIQAARLAVMLPAPKRFEKTAPLGLCHAAGPAPLPPACATPNCPDRHR
jgi:monofunctional biosynthetic peptidoglycan transglycosylase